MPLIVGQQNRRTYGPNRQSPSGRAVAQKPTAAVGLPASQNPSAAFAGAASSGVLLAHPGTQYSFRLAEQLQRHGRLASFHTSLAFTSNLFKASDLGILPKWAYRVLQNRIISGVPKEKVKIHAFEEAVSLLKQKYFGHGSEIALHRRNRCFQEAIPWSAIESARAVIGFDTSAWILAEFCRALGVPFILDQSIGHPIEKEEILSSLRERYPEWTYTIPSKSSEYISEERKEHILANLIVVPSSFVKETLAVQGVETAKIRIIPFGTDLRLIPSGI